jgi:hypothetical protein
MRSNAPLERVIDPTDLLTYYAGIFNGNGRNITINDNNNFMFARRLELQPFTGTVFGQPSFLKLGGACSKPAMKRMKISRNRATCW